MINRVFNRQFLLTTKIGFDLPWECVKISNYSLYHHPEIELTQCKTSKLDVYLLGYLYDLKNPASSNIEILESLSQFINFNDFIIKLNQYAGQFVLIYKSQSDFKIINDACAQYEVYYDTTYSAFGSQPKLLEKVIVPEQHKSKEAREFYLSSDFKVKKVFIGNTTHRSNIFHLLPNHFIDINQKSIERFFPILPLKEISVDEAAQKAVIMLKGYIKAASIRNQIALAITGGYDSRILFLASLDLDCKYFVSKHKNMTDKHYDIVIPKRLTSIHNKMFEVIPDEKETTPKLDLEEEQSIDFPRNQINSSKQFDNHVYLNGNISEIARNYYGNIKNVKPADLAYLNGYAKSPFIENIYSNWINSNAERFSELGYNLLDMFYWEEKMGNWAAKAKTEAALDRVVFSPFCSRELLVTLLSTNRKNRDSHFNKLYNRMIFILSSKALKVPINPCRKQRIIRLMKTFKVYGLYRKLGLKYRLLKI